MKFRDQIIISIFLVAFYLPSAAQLPPSFKPKDFSALRSTDVIRKYLSPVRIVQVSDLTGRSLQNVEQILIPGIGQADLNGGKCLTLLSDSTEKPWIILDFGREIQGGIELITSIKNHNPAGRVRIRFGESVSETMSEVSKNGATNDSEWFIRGYFY